MCPLNITSLQKTQNITNSKTYLYLIANDEQNIMITTEKILEERKSIPLM